MTGFIHWCEQVLAVTRFSLHTLPQRRGTSAASVFGIAGVVAVLVGTLSIAEGFRHAMTAGTSSDTALILRSGSDSEMVSILEGDEARIIADAAGIQRVDNAPASSPELSVIINLPKRSTGTDANVPLRGVHTSAFTVHQDLKITEGRRFDPGKNEVIVGRGATNAFAGVDLNARIKVGRNEWTVVGIFTAGEGVAESEIWTDANVLQQSYNRGNTYQSVAVKMTSPEAFNQFKDALTSDPRLNVKVMRLSDYYAEQSSMVYNLITGLGVMVASLMGVGAVFGALNTMYTAVSARTREMATLRALGFGTSPVILSVMAESMLLALLGGTVGGSIAYMAFDGFRAATINWQSFSQVAFAFQVTPSLLTRGIVYATLIGLVGGLFPAIRAARLPLATALREL